MMKKTPLIGFRCFFAVVVSTLLLSGCDDTKIDPAKKKERYRVELLAVFRQMDDVSQKLASIKWDTRGNRDESKRSIAEARKYIDIFLTVDASKCPREARQTINELKAHFRKLRGYFDEIESAVDEMYEIQKKPAQDQDQDRQRIIAARMFELQGTLVGSWMTDTGKTATKLDEIAKEYGIDPADLKKEMSASTPVETQPKKPAWTTNSKVKPSGPAQGTRRRVLKTEPAAEAEQELPSKPEKPAPPKIMTLKNGEIDVIAYMQPVYDHLFTHMEKLITLGRDSNASSRDRLAAAERAMKFIEHYRNSNFPDDFLEKLEYLRQDIVAYEKSTGEKQLLEKIAASMKNTNDLVELYGCIAYELP